MPLSFQGHFVLFLIIIQLYRRRNACASRAAQATCILINVPFPLIQRRMLCIFMGRQ